MSSDHSPCSRETVPIQRIHREYFAVAIFVERRLMIVVWYFLIGPNTIVICVDAFICRIPVIMFVSLVVVIQIRLIDFTAIDTAAVTTTITCVAVVKHSIDSMHFKTLFHVQIVVMQTEILRPNER